MVQIATNLYVQLMYTKEVFKAYKNVVFIN